MASSRPVFRVARLAVALALAIAAPLAPLGAQAQSSSLANSLSGFSVNSDKPVSIRSDVIELRDRDKIAICTGNVSVTQGDVTIRTAELRVNYVGGEGGDERRIQRLEAIGKVLVTLKDQTLSGDHALFEMARQLITVDGNVVLSQGGNVLRGSRLVVDLKSGRSRLEAGSGNSGRVQGSFLPSSRPRADGAQEGAAQ